jgi:hypothetical protein
MPADETSSTRAEREAAPDQTAEGRPLPPAAQRALAEAAARRAQQPADKPKEVGGRGGPEPTRYGDWEINGLTSDF